MKMSQLYADREAKARQDEGPDQEYPEIVAVAIPVLIEVISVCLMFACAFVWLAIKATA